MRRSGCGASAWGAALVLLALGGCAALPQRAEAQTVAGFGDSLTWDPGYLEQLPAEWEIVNLSEGGECSWDGVVRLEQILPALDAHVVVLMEGTNDVRNTAYTLELSVESLTAMMDAVLAAGMSVVLMAPPPLLPYDPTVVPQGANARLIALAPELEAAAALRGYPFVDLFPIFAELDPLTAFYFDGVHPNELGSAVIAQAVVPAIEEALVIPEPATTLLLGAGLGLLAILRR